MKLKMIVAAIALTASASAFAAGPKSDQIKNNGDKVESVSTSSGVLNVRTDASYSQHVLNNRNVTSIALDMLKARKSGSLAPNAIYVSGKGEIYGTYGNMSRNGTNRSISTTNVKMPHVAFTSTIGTWVTGFADLQVTNIGSKNINFPNVYFTVGNLEKSPFYLVGGKKVVDFGKFNSPNNFAPTLTRTYFMAYGSQVAAGFCQGNVNATFTLLNGFGQSMLNSEVSKSSQLSDFALSTSYTGKFNSYNYYLGIGYINSTGFSHNTSGSGGMVGAVDLNAGIKAQGLAVNSEFLITTRGVKSTNSSSVYQKRVSARTVNPTSVASSTGYTALGFNTLPKLVNFTSGVTVKSWSIDSSYTMPVSGRDMVPYAVYSHVAQNSNNNLYQLEVGTRYNVINTVWVGASYNYMSGKTNGVRIGKFNTVMLDLSAYF